MSAISQQDWQDQEDGRALRELREALPDRMNQFIEVTSPIDGFGWVVDVIGIRDSGDGVLTRDGHSLAFAADKCRAALRER